MGSADGIIYETVLEPTDEYFKKEEKYFRQVYSINDGTGDSYITDIHYEYMIPLGSNPANGPRLYFVVVATRNRLTQFVGKQPLMYPPVNVPLFESIFNQGFQTNQEFMAAFKDGQNVDSVDKEVLTSNVSFFSPIVSGESDNVIYAFDSNGKRLYPFINSKSFSWLTSKLSGFVVVQA